MSQVRHCTLVGPRADLCLRGIVPRAEERHTTVGWRHLGGKVWRGTAVTTREALGRSELCEAWPLVWKLPQLAVNCHHSTHIQTCFFFFLEKIKLYINFEICEKQYRTWDVSLERGRQTAVRVFCPEESDIRRKAKRILSATLKPYLLEGKTHTATPVQLITERHYSNAAPFRKARWKSHQERVTKGTYRRASP